MKIVNAWYPRQMPTQIIVEMPDGYLGITHLTPARIVTREELQPYTGYAPDKCADPIPVSYWRGLYGFTEA